MNSLAPKYLNYIYFLAVLLFTWEGFLVLSKYNKINPYLIRFKENVGTIMTYIIVAFFGAALASGYWWGIQKVFTNQEIVLKESPETPRVEGKKEITESKKYKTLYDCFKGDFQRLLKISNSVKLSKPNSDEVTTIEYNVYMDSESNSKFISYYVPLFRDSSKTYEVILALINSHIAILERIDSGYTIDSYTPGDSSYTYSKDLKFSGKIYIYFAGDLSLEYLGEISKQYKNKGLILQLRDQGHATIQNLSKEKKELPVKQRIERKTEIINQLNQFVRNGNALLLKIGNAHSSQFPSKYPLQKNMKPSPMELKIAEWKKEVYNYLIVDVPAWAKYYHKLSTQDMVVYFKPYMSTHDMSTHEKYRVSMKAMIEAYIERILEIIRHVDS